MLLKGKDGDVEIQPQTIAALKLTWPRKDIDVELARMHLWLETHKSRRPANVMRFIKAWLAKAPDRALPRPPTLAEQRRANLNVITGRGNAEPWGSIGGKVVHTISGDLRESDDDHVGRLRSVGGKESVG